MSHLSASLISSLLIAMLASGCASQDAMSLLPDNVKLDVARDKATKEGPVSVDEMMAKARTLHPETGKKTKVTNKLDETKTAALQPSAQHEDAPVQAAYAEEAKLEQLEPVNNRVNNNSPADLFQQALLLNQQTQIADQTQSATDSYTATADQWRALIAQQEGENSVGSMTNSAILASVETPLVMPLAQVEIIPVNFNEAHNALANQDDLKLRLLRFGKRLPMQITIGKVTNAQGFEVMKSAIALGNIVAQASGGAPEITYDPSLSEGAAEVRYPTIGRQS
jgi:hypothetical protein